MKRNLENKNKIKRKGLSLHIPIIENNPTVIKNGEYEAPFLKENSKISTPFIFKTLHPFLKTKDYIKIKDNEFFLNQEAPLCHNCYLECFIQNDNKYGKKVILKNSKEIFQYPKDYENFKKIRVL